LGQAELRMNTSISYRKKSTSSKALRKSAHRAAAAPALPLPGVAPAMTKVNKH
jgi:hypothetical protein